MSEYDILEMMKAEKMRRKQRSMAAIAQDPAKVKELEQEIGKLIVKIFALGVCIGAVIGILLTTIIAILTGVI